MENENLQSKQREDNVSNYFCAVKLPLWKQITLFLVGWLGFQITAVVIQYLIYFANMNSGQSMHDILLIPVHQMLVNAFAYLILCGGLIAILNVDINKLLKSFRHWKPYVAAIACFAAIYAFNIIWNAVIGLVNFPASENANQAAIESITDKFPLTSIVIFGLVGPICEELTYRVGLFSLCKRKGKCFAYVITIIVFAFIHFNFNREPLPLLNEILNLPFYAFAAAAFSFVYDRFGFAASTAAHITNNLFSLVVPMILKQFN